MHGFGLFGQGRSEGGLACLGRGAVHATSKTIHCWQAERGERGEGRTTHFQTRCTLRLEHLHLLLDTRTQYDTHAHIHTHTHTRWRTVAARRGYNGWCLPRCPSGRPIRPTTFQPQPWVAYVNTWDKTHKRTLPLYVHIYELTYVHTCIGYCPRWFAYMESLLYVTTYVSNSPVASTTGWIEETVRDHDHAGAPGAHHDPVLCILAFVVGWIERRTQDVLAVPFLHVKVPVV